MAPDPVPDAAIPTIIEVPSDTRFRFSRNDCTVLCTSLEQNLDSEFRFSTKACYIYAETIKLQSNLKLQGKELHLFCNTLLLTTSDTAVSIDVSGKPGPDVIGLEETAASDGGPGDPGGKITLYVETLTQNVLSNLKLIANGGDGGGGSHVKDTSAKGGDGGRGGDAGEIVIGYSCTMWTLFDLLDRITVQAGSMSWLQVSEALLEDRIGAWTNFGPVPFQDSILNGAASMIDRFRLFAVLTRGLSGLVRTLVEKYTKLQESASVDVWSSWSKIFDQYIALSVGQYPEPPDEVGLDHCMESYQSLLDDMETADSSLDTDDLQNKLGKLFTIPIKSHSTDESILVKSIVELRDEAEGSLEVGGEDIRQSMCHSWGGNGGNPDHTIIKPGKTGASGSSTKPVIHLLALDGRQRDLKMPQAFAFPEQCQMVLLEADQLYFSASPGNWAKAEILYRTLKTRLQFLHPRSKPNTNSALDTSSSSALLQNYAALEDASLSFDMVSRLEDIWSRCDTCLRRMAAGQDMFGWTEDWVPRTSYLMYEKNIATMISSLTKVEELEKMYLRAVSSQDDAKTIISSQQAVYNQQMTIAHSRMEYLNSDHGPIKTALKSIERDTPSIKAQFDILTKKLMSLKDKVKNSFSVQPEDVFEALTSICFAPNKYMGLLQVLQYGYKAVSQVHDVKGSPINRDYLVSTFGKAGTTFGSLVEGYSAVRGSIQVTDPGAAMLMASEQEVNDLLDQFVNILGKETTAEVKKEFADFLALVRLRNDAVIDYNAAVKLYDEAAEDLDRAKAMSEKLDPAETKLDPRLPSVYYMITQRRLDLHRDIMRMIDLAKRALWYWGLVPSQRVMVSLQNHNAENLQVMVDDLTVSHQTVVDQFNQDIRGVFPSTESEVAADGQVYCLTPEQRKEFQDPKYLNKGEAGQKVFYEVAILFEYGMLTNEPDFPEKRLWWRHWDIRLNQVRFWIAGLKPLQPNGKMGEVPVEIMVESKERIYVSEGKYYDFRHGDVGLVRRAIRNADKIKTLEDCGVAAKYDSKLLMGMYNKGTDEHPSSQMSIGPWSMWRFKVDSVDKIDMKAATAAWVEFQGTAV